MTAAVSERRWHEAQSAEGEYWQTLGASASECGRVLAEKASTADWIARELVELPAGDWLEIGIGPLGAGCIHFLPGAERHRLVGVEPLPLLDLDRIALPEPFVAAARACRAADYEHVRSPGEATPLEPERFSLAVCFNVLDHVRDPLAVLREARRLLAPQGLLVLGCDTVSAASRLRARYERRRYPQAVGVRAHPFRFAFPELLRLAGDAGFRIERLSSRSSRVQQLLGHSRRPVLVCRVDPS